jgi:CubicO group peptidase (beta-lactamase class C family)
VVARVIEVISEESLYSFEKERILDPLGMADTSFYVTDKGNQARVERSLVRGRRLVQRSPRGQKMGIRRWWHGVDGS